LKSIYELFVMIIFTSDKCNWADCLKAVQQVGRRRKASITVIPIVHGPLW
jgi:hypothetical protein